MDGFPRFLASAGFRLTAGFLVLAVAASPARAAKGDCGQPSSSGSAPTAQDALYTLRTAVGSLTCDLCICDVNASSKVTAADALLLLKKAVGQDVPLACPACEPTLSGVVLLPTGQLSASAAPSFWSLLQATVFGHDAVASVSGLMPAAGATVELLDLDAEGNVQLPALATTTTNADGGYSLTPLPVPGSRKIVRATLEGEKVRAFVAAGIVDIDPVTEMVVSLAVDAVQADAGAGLDSLTVAEIEALTTLVREADVDLAAAQSVAEALDLLALATGGVYADVVGEFATGAGPGVALAGSYNLVVHEQGFERSFQPPTLQVPGINTRIVQLSSTGSLLTVAANGGLTLGNATGSGGALTETSGSVKHESGPDTAINASATLESGAIDEPGPTGQTLLGSPRGALLLDDGDNVFLGAQVAGGSLAVVPGVFLDPSSLSGGRVFHLALRQGSGLGKSSLNGTYWMVQFEAALQANSDAFNVHRGVEGRHSVGTMSFDGNGHLSLSATEGRNIALLKNGPPPGDPAEDPVVTLSDEATSEGAEGGLSYTLSSTGALVVKSGAETVAQGAVTPNAAVVVLRFGGDDAESVNSGFLVAIKRGSGMGDDDGDGTYRSVSIELGLQHQSTIGTPDVSPDTNRRTVDVGSDFGSFELDGNGHLAIGSSVFRDASLQEHSNVMRHTMGDDDVMDAVVSIRTFTDGESTPQNANYSVASNGLVTVDLGPDGTQEGYLSPDGNLFLLPQFETDDGRRFVGIMLGLRQP